MLFNFVPLQEIQASINLKEFLGTTLAFLSLCFAILGIYKAFSSKLSKDTYKEDRDELNKIIEKKAESRDLESLKERIGKKADQEYLEIVLGRLVNLENRFEKANFELRKEFLNNVKAINDTMFKLQDQIIDILSKNK